ncbi:hypothetical protein JCM8208_005402 [Rhodotorula glutinis]
MLAQAYSASALDPHPPAPSSFDTAPRSSSPPSPATPLSDEDMRLGQSDGTSTSSTSLDHPEPSKPPPLASALSPSPPRRASHLGGSLPASASPATVPPSNSLSASHGAPRPGPGATINPLFALGEQVRSGAIDPSLVRFQQGGVVVREGPPPRVTPRSQTPQAEVDGPGWTEWLHERVHPRRAQRANGGMTGAGAGAAGAQDSVGEGSGCRHQPGRPLELDGGDGDGGPKHVDDFRDQPDQQDHADEARIKLREWKSDFQDRLEDTGLRAPSPWRRDGSPARGARDDLESRLAAMLDRPPGHEQPLGSSSTDGEGDERRLRPAPSSTLGSASFYSAVSDTDAEAPFVPARSESPVSYASTAEPHQPVASTSIAAPPPPPPAPAPDALDRAPVVFAPGFVATNSRLVPLPDQPQHRTLTGQASHTSLSSSPPRLHAIPAHEVAAPSADLRPLHLQPPASPRARHRPSQLGAPPSPRAAASSQHLHPPSPSTSAHRSPSPTFRRSQTTDSPPLLSGPLVPGAPALGNAVGSRRFSSASTGARLSPSTAQRSQSFSTASAFPPTSPTLLSPNGTIVLDDVDASIAAQAEAIRRQRQEKRAEAEKEQAKLAAAAAAARSSASLAPPHASSSGLAALASGSGPGGLKRRTTRMGSGGSERDGPSRSASGPAPPGTAGSALVEGEEGALATTSANAHAHPGPGARQRSRGPGMGLEGDEGQRDEMGAGVLVGNLIGQDHANYVLMYNMLTGIRIGVSRCQAKAARPLTDADYTARHKFSFDIVGNELTPSVRYDFKFKDYAPWVFRELREYFYLDPSDYLMSLTSKYILSELGSPGKSGSFFYFSRDYRFIIKTIRHSEHKFLRSILKEYHEHVKRNPHTLLSRFYGLHRVKLPHGRKIHFVIMNNLFPPHRDIHETYDLKGSAIGRLYPEDKAAANPHAVLKDLNWVGRNRQFALGPEKKALFEEQLRRDTELLQRLGIMDYSLLTGIHNGVRGNSEGLREDKLSVFQPAKVKVSRKPTQVKRDADASALRKAVQQSDPQALGGKHELPEHDNSERRMFLFYQDEGGMRASGDSNEDLGAIYYLGIIDILTPYTFVKRLEHFFKGFQHNKHMISAVPPREYGDRFLAFVKSSIRGNDVSTRPQMFEHEPKHDRAHKAELSEKEVSTSSPAPPAPPPQEAVGDPEKAPPARQEMQERADTSAVASR